MYKGEGYWEEANGDLHCRGSTVSLPINMITPYHCQSQSALCKHT